jgi:hypothetical protein
MWITVFSVAAILALCLSGIAVLAEKPGKLSGSRRSLQ